MHNARAKGAYIRGTGGKANGLVPMLRVFNNTARYVDQGGGKRKGSIAIYLEPWHMDVREFLELRKNTGAEEARARGECGLTRQSGGAVRRREHCHAYSIKPAFIDLVVQLFVLVIRPFFAPILSARDVNVFTQARHNHRRRRL